MHIHSSGLSLLPDYETVQLQQKKNSLPRNQIYMLRRYLIDCFAGKWLTSFGNRIVVGKTWGRNRSVESSLVGEQRSRIGVLCISISAFVDCSLQVLGHRSAMDRIPILSYSPECYRSTSINYLKQVRNGKKGGMREQHKTQEIDATRRFIEADERFVKFTSDERQVFLRDGLFGELLVRGRSSVPSLK